MAKKTKSQSDLPVLKKTGFRKLENIETVDRFHGKTFDDHNITLEIKANGQCLVLAGIWQILGVARDVNEGFQFLHNVCVYNYDELNANGYTL